MSVPRRRPSRRSRLTILRYRVRSRLPGWTPPPPGHFDGINPLSRKMERHTPAEWRKIHEANALLLRMLAWRELREEWARLWNELMWAYEGRLPGVES